MKNVSRRLSIGALPAGTSEGNPYFSQLYNGLSALGVEIVDLRPFRAGFQRFDIIHLHWPEALLGPERSLKRFVRYLAIISLAKVRGASVVWTAHNIEPHERTKPWLEKLAYSFVIRVANDVIVLSQSSLIALKERYPRLRKLRHHVIPHGHYIDAYPKNTDRFSARQSLGLPDRSVVASFVGSIRPYKGVDELITCFKDVAGEDFRLIVAGSTSGPDVDGAIKRDAESDPRITLLLHRLSNEELANVVVASDFIVLPFRQILESGSLLLALSLGRPVLTSAATSTRELAQQVGDDWVRTFEMPLSTATLDAGFEWGAMFRSGLPDLSARDWSLVVEQHRDVYLLHV